MAEQFSRLHI